MNFKYAKISIEFYEDNLSDNPIAEIRKILTSNELSYNVLEPNDVYKYYFEKMLEQIVDL